MERHRTRVFGEDEEEQVDIHDVKVDACHYN